MNPKRWLNGREILYEPGNMCCTFCGDPFELLLDKGHYKAWRGKDGKLYCSDMCEKSGQQFEEVFNGTENNMR